MKFKLTKKEQRRYKKFRNKMLKKYSREDYFGAAGTGFEIIFGVTGIGNTVGVYYDRGGSNETFKNITDFDSW